MVGVTVVSSEVHVEAVSAEGKGVGGDVECGG